jgi:aldehyde dehydrogenase (NAD+)
MLEKSQVFIGGEWVDSASPERLVKLNPVTEAPLVRFPRGCLRDVDRAVQAAGAAFPGWSCSPLERRIEVFERLAALVDARSDDITRTIVSEVGQPLSQAAQTQTLEAVLELQIIAEALTELAWTQTMGRSDVRRVPAGVVAAITPRNVPLRSLILKAGAAMAAGCTVVAKGSEVAPLTACLFADLMTAAGLPDGVFNLVSGNGPEIGEALAAHSGVDMVSLSGSVRAGRRVMELAAARIRRVHLELGGKCPNILCEDADFDLAVTAGIADAFRHAGQASGAFTRMLVPRSRLSQVEEMAAAEASRYVPGDPLDPKTTLGPLVTAGQRQRVRNYIWDGLNDGARLIAGGPEAPVGLERGYFVQPTVFSCDNQLPVARDEIFGPVVVLIPYDSEEEAIAMANDSPYGLAAGIWAQDKHRARQLATRLRVGRVLVNGQAADKRAPHGGFKYSGIGRSRGRLGLETFLEYQSIVA